MDEGYGARITKILDGIEDGALPKSALFRYLTDYPDILWDRSLLKDNVVGQIIRRGLSPTLIEDINDVLEHVFREFNVRGIERERLINRVFLSFDARYGDSRVVRDILASRNPIRYLRTLMHILHMSPQEFIHQSHIIELINTCLRVITQRDLRFSPNQMDWDLGLPREMFTGVARKRYFDILRFFMDLLDNPLDIFDKIGYDRVTRILYFSFLVDWLREDPRRMQDLRERFGFDEKYLEFFYEQLQEEELIDTDDAMAALFEMGEFEALPSIMMGPLREQTDLHYDRIMKKSFV